MRLGDARPRRRCPSSAPARRPTIPSWGNIMAEGRTLWQVKPFIVFFPALFLSVTVLAVNMLGDGLRDALDPRLAKRI